MMIKLLLTFLAFITFTTSLHKYRQKKSRSKARGKKEFYQVEIYHHPRITTIATPARIIPTPVAQMVVSNPQIPQIQQITGSYPQMQPLIPSQVPQIGHPIVTSPIMGQGMIHRPMIFEPVVYQKNLPSAVDSQVLVQNQNNLGQKNAIVSNQSKNQDKTSEKSQAKTQDQTQEIDLDKKLEKIQEIDDKQELEDQKQKNNLSQKILKSSDNKNNAKSKHTQIQAVQSVTHMNSQETQDQKNDLQSDDLQEEEKKEEDSKNDKMQTIAGKMTDQEKQIFKKQILELYNNHISLIRRKNSSLKLKQKSPKKKEKIQKQEQDVLYLFKENELKDKESLKKYVDEEMEKYFTKQDILNQKQINRIQKILRMMNNKIDDRGDTLEVKFLFQQAYQNFEKQLFRF